MKIGVISDTHGCLRDDVLSVLSGCSCIIHAGDIGSSDVADKLKSAAKLYAVQGNADTGMESCLDKHISFCADGVNFEVVHNKKDIKILSTKTNIVVYGHTHRYAEAVDDNGVLWLNPGYCGRSRLNQKITMAVIQTDDGRYTVKKIIISDRKVNLPQSKKSDMLANIKYIVENMDKNRPMDKIAAKIGVSEEFVETIYRIRVTHPDADFNDIYNKLEVNETIKRHFL